MIVFKLLYHELLNGFRSSSFQRNAVVSILMGFFIFLMFLYLLSAAFALDYVIRNFLEIDDTISFLNSFLIYYFLLEIMMRYFFQSTPNTEPSPYLIHPIHKSTIVHYLLGRSFFTPFNGVVIVLFAPFAFRTIGIEMGVDSAWMWLLTLTALSWSIHFFTLWFKRTYGNSLWAILFIIILALALAGTDYFGWVQLSVWTAPFFNLATASVLPVILSIFSLIALYLLCYNFHKKHCYTDELGSGESSKIAGQHLISFSRFGVIGNLIDLELKLMLRHKRPRNILILTAIFLLYGLLFYPDYNPEDGFVFILIFLGIFITGIFIMNYGQFLFSWNSAYFDYYLTAPFSMQQYVNSKYYLLSGVSLICFLLAIPYAYFGYTVIIANTAMFLYNVGVNSILIMNMAMWGPKKLDLTRKSAFSMDGVGAAQWLMGFPAFLGPILIYVPFAILGISYVGFLVIGFIGLIAIAFRNPLLEWTARRLQVKKYQIASAFRNE